MDSALAELHRPLNAILRHVLAFAPLPRSGIALDLACGAGLKTSLLAGACGSGVRLVGLDRDAGAIRRAQAASTYGRWVVGDAAELPLRNGCCDVGFCIAALGLFADRRAALRELRRVLRPGGLAIIVMGTQAWAPVTRWPGALAAPLCRAYAGALAENHLGAAASSDLSDDLALPLREAGFDAPHVRAFLLDADNPLAAELALLPWASLRPLVAARLAPAELAGCDRCATDAEIELCTLALVAQARVAAEPA